MSLACENTLRFVGYAGSADVAQLARASPCQGEGRGFEPRHPLHSSPPEALLFGAVFCYTSLMSFLHLYMRSWLTRTYVFLGLLLTAHPVFAAKIPLLEDPIENGRGSVEACPGLGTFFVYFNKFWPWLIGSATGIAVLMTIVGGLQVIMSGGDQGKRSEGTTRFMHALIGLLMLACAGLILRTLNPSFFTSGSGINPCTGKPI